MDCTESTLGKVSLATQSTALYLGKAVHGQFDGGSHEGHAHGWIHVILDIDEV